MWSGTMRNIEPLKFDEVTDNDVVEAITVLPRGGMAFELKR